MEIEAVLQANKNLSKKIAKFEEDQVELMTLRERVKSLRQRVETLERQLHEKRNVIKIIARKKDSKFTYVAQLLEVNDTEEGLLLTINGDF